MLYWEMEVRRQNYFHAEIRSATKTAPVRMWQPTKVFEPYVVAPMCTRWPAQGRGGLDLVHRSASWMYRAGLEWILGFRVAPAYYN